MDAAKATSRPLYGFIPNPKLKLREQLREVMRFKQFSPRTEDAYWIWIRQFILFHGKRHPRDLGKPEVEAFLSHLTTAKNVAVSTQNQALNALVFLYREVLRKPFDQLGAVERPLRRPKVPVVLSQPEAGRLLTTMEGTTGLFARLLYGSGVRLLEGLRLRVKDLDFGYRAVLVRDGKGAKGGHTNRAGATRARGRSHHADLYPCARARRAGCAEPAGSSSATRLSPFARRTGNTGGPVLWRRAARPRGLLHAPRAGLSPPRGAARCPRA